MIWYFDVVSPFAYLALPQIEAWPAPVTMRPIVLGAVLAHWKQLGPAEIVPKRLHTYRLCQFLADQAGLPFRFPPAHPFRSLEALRLLAALDDPRAVRIVFDFIWAEGRDPVADRPALCARLGVDPDVPITDDAKTRLRSWTEDAIAAGVFGVPALVVDREVFWGLDALPMARAHAADAGLFARGEMARIGALPVGITR